MLVEQDIYAAAYVPSVAFDLANEADAGLGEEASRGAAQDDGRPLLRDRRREIRARAAPAGAARGGRGHGGVMDEIKGCLVPVRYGRSFDRAGLGRPRANHHGSTYKRVF